ncbi:hypothetical protein ACFL40_03335 [candidate division KSB1 bacterium]
MIHNYLHVFIPIFALIINICAHILLFRFISRIGLLIAVIISFFIGFFCLIAFECYVFFSVSQYTMGLIYLFTANGIIYSLLGYLYFQFVNLGETARRIRIMRELYSSKDGLSMEEILKRYNAKEIIGRRINRLVRANQVKCKNNKYYIKGMPFILFLSKTIVTMKLILLGKRSEFD